MILAWLDNYTAALFLYAAAINAVAYDDGDYVGGLDNYIR